MFNEGSLRGKAMLRKWFAGAVIALSAGAVQAQTDCGRTYVLKDGDTLLSVAQAFYSERSKWSVIYYANEEALGGNLVDLPKGVTLNIPCLDGETVAAKPAKEPVKKPVKEPVQVIKTDPTPLIQDNAGIKIVTGSNYAPFTDQNWPGNGMAYELVNAAFEASPSPLPFSIVWENDWSKHLFPMLDSKQVDMGFPWYKPDCVAEPDNKRCTNFHFSDPIFDTLVLLYTRVGDGFKFDEDEDIFGKTICREKGYFTHDLDGPDRRWLTKGLVKLRRAKSTDACFKLLVDGKVDAVSVNEFLGASKIKELKLQDKVEALPRSVGAQGLHVVISKRHWRGTTNLYRFNAGLAKLKTSARYEEIVSRHLNLFWERN